MKNVLVVTATIYISSMSIFGELTVDQSYRINFTDVDGNAFSTADGHITTVVLTSKANIDKARLVGDRIPDFCLANPTYRMVTVLEFEAKHSGPVRAVLKSVMRHRLDSEARRLQTRYDQLKIEHDARRDVSAVADFDGAISAQLGAKPSAALFQVFIFGKNGELLRRWNDVPSAEELAARLK